MADQNYPVVARPSYLDSFGGTVPVIKEEPEWKKGIASSVDELQALGGGIVGLAGQAVGSEGLRDWGLDVYRRNMQESTQGWQAPKVANLEDIKIADPGGLSRAVDWAVYQGTKGLGTIATAALGGGVGGIAGKVLVKGAIKKVAANVLSKAAVGPVVSAAMRKSAKKAATGIANKAIARGATAGAVGTTFGLESGGEFGSLTSEGVSPEKALGPSIGVGALNSALEVVPLFKLAKDVGLLPWAKKAVVKVVKADPKGLGKRVRQLATNVVLGAGKYGSIEGVTEGLQELVSIAGDRVAKNKKLFDDLSAEDRSRILNAAAPGVLSGGILGSIAGPVSKHGAAPTAQGGITQQPTASPIKPTAPSTSTPPTASPIKPNAPSTSTPPTASPIESPSESSVVGLTSPQARQQQIDKTMQDAAISNIIPNPDAGLQETTPTGEQINVLQMQRAPGEVKEGIPEIQGAITPEATREKAAQTPVVPSTSEVINASQNREATQIYGNVLNQERPQESQFQVPTDESGQGVLTREDSTPPNILALDPKLVADLWRRQNMTPATSSAKSIGSARDFIKHEVLPIVNKLAEGWTSKAKLTGNKGVSRGDRYLRDLIDMGYARELRDSRGNLFYGKADIIPPANLVSDAKFGSKGGYDIEYADIAPLSPRDRPKNRGRGHLLDSPAVGESAKPVSLIDFISASDKLIGQGITQRAIDAGALRVNQVSAEGSPAGFFNKATGVMEINLDRIPKGQSPESVLLHEGRHAGLHLVLGDTLPSFHQDLINLANNGSQTALQGLRNSTQALANSLGIESKIMDTELSPAEWQQEYTRVREEVSKIDPTLLAEEDLAHFIQAAANKRIPEAGFFRQLINAIKTWWAQTQVGQAFARAGIRPTLSDSMALEFAKASIKRATEQAERVGQAVQRETRIIEDVPSAARVAVLDSRYAMATRTGQSADITIGATPRQIEGLLNRERAKATREGQPFFEGVRILKDPRDGTIYAWPADANLLHKDVALEMGIDTGLYNIVPVSGQVVEPGQIREVIDEMPVSLEGLKKEFSFDTIAPRVEAEPLTLEDLGIGDKPLTIEQQRGLANELLYSDQFADQVQQIKSKFYTSPVSEYVEKYSQPGLFNKWFAGVVDQFHYVKGKSPRLYTAFDEWAAKQGAAQSVVKREYMEPLRHLVSKIKIDPADAQLIKDQQAAQHMLLGDQLATRVAEPRAADVVGHQLAARHVVLDDVNGQLALRAAPEFLKTLRGDLDPNTIALLDKAIEGVTGGSKFISKLTDLDAAILLKRFLPSESDPSHPIGSKWAIFKRRASGYSTAVIGSEEYLQDKADGFMNAMELYNQRVINNPEFEQIEELVDTLGRYTLQTLREGGLLTDTAIAKLESAYSHYVPLRRELYDYDEEVRKIFDTPNKSIGKLYGREGSAELPNAVHVIQNVLAQAYTASATAARNQMMNQFADELYEDSDKKLWGDWFKINDKSLNNGSMGFVRKGKSLYVVPQAGNLRAAGIARAIKKLDAHELVGPTKLMRAVNSWIRWVNVAASPYFMLTNIPRDAGTALYNLQATEAKDHWKEVFGNYKNAAKALGTVVIKGVRDKANATPKQVAQIEMVERFEKAGGSASFVESLRSMDGSWKSFEAQVGRRRGKLGAVVEWGTKNLDAIENLNIAVENVMRLATFDTLVKNGISDQRAAQISRDLTTNFTRRGYHTNAINTWWLFFNATVQGNWQVVQNIMQGVGKKKLQAAIGGTIAFSFLIDQLGQALSDDSDEDGISDWNSRSSYQKEKVISIPFKIGDTYPSIPAPWGYNAFWRLGSLLSEVFSGITKPQDAALDSIGLMFNTMNPIQSGSAAQAVSPTAFDPIMQIIENKNFVGNPLGPEGYPGASKRPDAYLAWRKTPEGYKSLAKFMNEVTGGNAVESGAIDLRPSTYEVLANTMLGSLGRFVEDAVNSGWTGTFGKDPFKVTDIPVLKPFTATPTSALAVSLYNDRVSKILVADKLVKTLSSGPDKNLVELRKVQSDRASLLRMVPNAKDVERQIKDLRKSLRLAESRGDSRTEKRLQDRILQLQQRFNQSYARRVGN